MSTIPPEQNDPFFIENRLQDYLEGTLGAEEMAFVEEGLKQYPELKLRLEDIRYSKDLLRSKLQVEPPADLLSQIEAAVEAEKPPQQRSSQMPMLILLAAAVLLIFLIPDGDKSWSKDVASAQSIKATPIELPLNIDKEPHSNDKTPSSIASDPVPELQPQPLKRTKVQAATKKKRTAKLGASSVPVAEIYIPDDEKDAYAAADNYLSARQDLQEHSTIQTTNTKLLYDLEKAAQQQGIVVQTPNQKGLVPYELSQERPFQLITLQFTKEQWPAVNQMVNNMGGSVAMSSAELTQGSNTLDIEISYWYTP